MTISIVLSLTSNSGNGIWLKTSRRNRLVLLLDGFWVRDKNIKMLCIPHFNSWVLMSGTVTNTLWMLIIGAGKLIMIRLIIFRKESEFTRHQTRPLLMRDLISVNLAPLLRIVRRYFRLIFIMNRRYFFCLRDYIYIFVGARCFRWSDKYIYEKLFWTEYMS